MARNTLRGLVGAGLFLLSISSSLSAELRLGTSLVDVTPVHFPVIVNGSFLSKQTSEVVTPLHARAIVLADGDERIAIVVVDSCMIPRLVLDDVKELVAGKTNIKPDRILISATHTHSAGSSMSCLGTEADPTYTPYLRKRLVEAIVEANQELTPVQVGFGKIDAAEFTASRRWILRSDRMLMDPYGNRSVRAMMHTARNPDDVVGPSGPEDPELSLIAFQSLDGKPVAVLANFSMHYYGDRPISADYFGLFCRDLSALVTADDSEENECLAILSHGCSGDIWRRDYANPENDALAGASQEEYARNLAERAFQAYSKIQFRSDGRLDMLERRIPLAYRVPDAERLEWAKNIVEQMGDRPPQNKQEVYANEAVILHERQSTEVVLQAIQIGDIAITTTPNETYALTGLKLKLQSPFPQNMVIELANGGDGYIPPPEQHFLGGYNTWPARSAGLEEQAEPKIVENLLEMLESLRSQPRNDYRPGGQEYAKKVLDLKPSAYYRLDEFAPAIARDSSPRQISAFYEPGVAMFLEGPQFSNDDITSDRNRAVHFAGGRLRVPLRELGNQYTIILNFWNGMPVEGRDVNGWIFSTGMDYGLGDDGLHVGISGAGQTPGRLMLQSGKKVVATGETLLERYRWYSLAIVRDGENVRVYLDGAESPELAARHAGTTPSNADLFFAGRTDRRDGFEGRLDEIAIFKRALNGESLKSLIAK